VERDPNKKGAKLHVSGSKTPGEITTACLKDEEGSIAVLEIEKIARLKSLVDEMLPKTVHGSK